MREISTPAAVVLPDDADLTDLVVDAAERRPYSVAYRRRVGPHWEDVTAREFLAEVTALAKGLVAAGVEPGDRVGIMSRTRYEWTLADFALWFAGAVPVPIYETSSAEQVEWILSDSGAVACFVETPTHRELVRGLWDRLPELRHAWCFDEADHRSVADGGADVADDAVASRRAGLGAGTLATLIYTSGTTGRPKGCELSHRNLREGTENAVAGLGEVFGPGSSTLLFLPLAHVFARVIQVGCLEAGVTMGHSPDVADLVADLGEFQPTFVLSVPRVFEKVFNGAHAKAASEGRGRVFERAAAVAIRYSQAQDTGGASRVLRLQHRVFDHFVYGKLRAALGGHARWAVSGGAPLGARLGHFFRGIGLTVLEGYGLTETSAASTLNTPHAVRVGTVGRPIPGTAVRIAEDGEVLLAGPHVFGGYWANPQATAEAFDGTWFRSGDLGELDDDGFLRITGRKKEIIVTAGGKNVAPAPLEDRVRAHPLVSQCLVVGDGRPYVAALVTLDPESLPSWLTEHHRDPTTPPAELVDDPQVLAEIAAAVDAANRSVSQAEAVKRFAVLPVDFTESGGQLTPTLKLRREVIQKEFAAEVDRLYARPAS